MPRSSVFISLGGIAAALVVASAPAFAQPEVATDHTDYYPGDVVVVTGNGWLPGERVSLRLDQHPTLHDPYIFYATADSTGSFQNSDYIVEEQDLGTSFDLTATGETSGLIATTFFTDSPKVGSVAVGPQTGSVCSPGGGTATYSITVTRGSGGGSSGAFTANLSVEGITPDITAVFTPNRVSFTPGQTVRTATLTLSGSGSLVVGTQELVVSASTSANDFATGFELLQINGSPAIACPAPITVDASPGQCGAVVNFAATATGTPPPVVSYSNQPGSLFPIGTTEVTATAQNGCGAVSCVFTVTVRDVTPPTITVSNIARGTDPGQCSANIGVLGSSAVDPCGVDHFVGTRSDGAALSAPFPKGTTTITWSATDTHGNTSTATQQITVSDQENPTITTLDLARSTDPGKCFATVGSLQTTANDLCGVASLTGSRSDGALLTDPFPKGTTTITWLATDTAGNSAGATQHVTVADTEHPTLTAPASLSRTTGPGSETCGVGVGNADLGTPVASDNCGVTVTSEGIPAGNLFPVGATTITYTATDPSGNTATAIQTVTVVDDTPPTIAVSDITRGTDPGQCFATIGVLGASAADPCGVDHFVGTRSDGAALSAPFPKGTTTITWAATDTHGNTSTTTQQIMVSDQEKPTITPPSDLHRMTGADADGCALFVAEGDLGIPAASDNCDVAVTRAGVPADHRFPVGTTTITYTATDGAGNTASATQEVVIEDRTPPTITTLDLARGTDPGECFATFGSLQTAANDLCGVASLSGSRSDGAHLTDPFPKGTTTITWLATDIHGNTASATQHVVVSDSEPPAIQVSDLWPSTDPGTCAATFASLGATASDNCAVATLTGARSDGASLSDPFPLGLTTITWLATDTAGNSAGATQHVTVADTEHPTLTAPASLSRTTGSGSETCGVGVGNADLGTPVASDNCGVTVTSEGIPAGNLFPVGATTITYTATDPSGNTATAIQTVTVVDDTPPVVTGNDSTHPADAGSCSATITAFGVTARDNCGVANSVGARDDGLSLSDPFPIGLTTVTWTTTDIHGNTGTGTSRIRVEDHQAPSIAAPAAVNAVTGPGARVCGAVLNASALGEPVASDNCSVTVTRSGVPEGSVFPVGTTLITYTATDPSGNSATATQTVTVTDNTPPSLLAPAAVGVGTGPTATACGVVVSDEALGVPTASDNCSVSLTRVGVPSGNLFPNGATTITYTATDPSGNSVSATQVITVSDTTPPHVSAQNLTVPTDPGRCWAAITNLGAAATDNCAPPTVTGARSDGAALTDNYPKGSTTILWTATDAAGNKASATQTITVTNATPAAAISGPVSGFVVAVGVPVPLTGSFADDAGDLHTAAWSCDALSCAATVNESSRGVSGTMTFQTAGVFMVNLTVTDQCGVSSTASQVGGLAAMVVVYDPTAGFVTGGGWIQSPAGAYAANPSMVGKANFGFVSKYKKGATVPTGETEFQFQAGNLNFHSSSYDWLVISGARAQFKGLGTINGTGSYGFLLSAVDGDVNGGGGKDKFRIKISDRSSGSIVYDNQLGAPDSSAATTILGGGSVVIQTNGGKASAAAPATEAALAGAATPELNRLAQNRPNPFNPETVIEFALARPGFATLRVFDVRGARVRTLVDGSLGQGPHLARWNGLDELGARVPSGVYYALLETSEGYRDKVRMVLIK